MRARLHDPSGTPWWRAAFPAAALALFLLGVALPLGDAGKAALEMLAVATFVGGGLLVPRKPKPRDVEIEVRPGELRIRGGASFPRRLRSRQVQGASTARSGDALLLAIAQHGRPTPWVVEVTREQDLQVLRAALDVGRAGAGSVTWAAKTPGLQRAARLGRAATALIFVASAATLIFGGHREALDSAAFVAAALSVLLTLGAWLDGYVPRLRLDPWGVRAAHAAGDPVQAPWTEVEDCRATEKGLELALSSGERVAVETDFCPTAAGREHLAAQVRCAGRRARGEGEPAEAPSPRITALAPEESETAREWLTRVDTLSSLLREQQGYRGTGLDESDLWKVVTDPDAPPLTRAGAARALAQASPAARERVEELASALRDETDQRRLRVALEPDVNVASAELEELGPLEAEPSDPTQR